MWQDEPVPHCAWQVNHRPVGSGVFSHVSCDGAFRTRISRQAETPTERKIVLMCIERGVVDNQDSLRDADARGASLLLMNVGKPLEAGQHGLVDLYSAALPTEVLRQKCPEIESYCGVALPAERGMALVLRDLVKGIVRESAALDPAEGAVLPGIVGTMLASVFRDVGADAGDATLSRLYEKRIRRAIEDNFQDFALGPAMIAELVGISRSHLFHVARKAGLGIRQCILDTRLDQSRDMLENIACAARSITEIGYRCGFNDLSHFSRSFSGRFGVSPKAYREAARARSA